MNIKITTNLPDVIKEFTTLEQKQFPFAMALSLTWIAKDGQEKLMDFLPTQFNIRTPWPTSPYGIKVTAATKNNLWSSVFTKAPWITGFEEGEIRTPAGRTFAVPTAKVRRSKKHLITKAQRPAALLHKNKSKAFIARTKTGKLAIFQRVGKARHPVVLMYFLILKAQIDNRLHMYDLCITVVERNFDRRFEQAFAEAMRTTL